MRKISSKLAMQKRVYTKLLKVWLPGKLCVVTGKQATQCHHSRGRIGRLLCDMRWWLPVSDAGHRYIHDNPKIARERGWIASTAKWNVYEK